MPKKERKKPVVVRVVSGGVVAVGNALASPFLAVVAPLPPRPLRS